MKKVWNVSYSCADAGSYIKDIHTCTFMGLQLLKRRLLHIAEEKIAVCSHSSAVEQFLYSTPLSATCFQVDKAWGGEECTHRWSRGAYSCRRWGWTPQDRAESSRHPPSPARTGNRVSPHSCRCPLCSLSGQLGSSRETETTSVWNLTSTHHRNNTEVWCPCQHLPMLPVLSRYTFAFLTQFVHSPYHLFS